MFEKDYTVNDTVYCYKGTNILINKFDIRNYDTLVEVERNLSEMKLMGLELDPIHGNFDFNHLKKIHNYLFKDIYDFAGKIRQVDISKGNSQFCYSAHIEEQGKFIFRTLERKNFFKNLTKEEFAKNLSEFVGDLIALHPFREGNGRAIREFIRELCLSNGYELNFNNTFPLDRLEAEIDAFNCKYKKLENIFIKELNRI